MKKFFTIIFIIVFIVSFLACSNPTQIDNSVALTINSINGTLPYQIYINGSEYFIRYSYSIFYTNMNTELEINYFGTLINIKVIDHHTTLILYSSSWYYIDGNSKIINQGVL